MLGYKTDPFNDPGCHIIPKVADGVGIQYALVPNIEFTIASTLLWYTDRPTHWRQVVRRYIITKNAASIDAFSLVVDVVLAGEIRLTTTSLLVQIDGVVKKCRILL